LVCAQEAWAQLELDIVLFVPVGEAPHRTLEADPGAEVRVSLCERAVAGDERFSVSRAEVDRTGLSYTVDTLSALASESPEAELVLILGGDQAAALPSWHRPEEVVRLATVATVEREGGKRDEIAERVTSVGGVPVFFTMPRIDVSSSSIRERLAAGGPVRYLVPEGVARLIEERDLYSESAAVGAG